MSKELKVPCSGIIVFDKDKTILVATKLGNFSFPKGKRDKGETDLETAWRELREETGLTSEHVQLITNEYFDELSSKGNPSIRYFVGRLVKQLDIITFDEEELATVAWYGIDEALSLIKFKTERKNILVEAHKKYQNIMG